MNLQIKILLISLWCIGLNHLALGQIKTTVTFSNPFLKEINAANKTRKEYKKYRKDSVRRIKKLNKYFDYKIDSLSSQIKKETIEYTNLPVSKIDTLKSFQLDSTILQRQFEYYQGTYLNQIPDSIYTDYSTQTDSIKYKDIINSQDSLRYLQNRMLKQIESNITNLIGFDQLKPNQNAFNLSQKEREAPKNSFNRYRDKKNLKGNLKELSNSKLITQNKKLNEAHQSLSKLKKKYLTLPSSDDASSGIKRNSLKNQPLSKRLVFGGTFKITQAKSIDVDFSPSIAYRITKLLSSGVELSYIAKFGDGKEWHESFNTKTYGGRLFTDYSVIKSFYVHAELESISVPMVTHPLSDNDQSEIVLGAMAGIGKRLSIGKGVIGKVIVQYNFLYEENSELYTSPWVVRFGFDIKKLNKINKVNQLKK